MLLKLPLHPRAVALIILCCCAFALSAQQAASIAFRDADGVVRYQADTLNNYIADFSHAGYKNGEAELPDVPVVKTILVIEGDNTAHIQAALDEVAARSPDANGYRGALLLEAGRYEVSGQLFIRESGMVLRGVGQEVSSGSNTIIAGTGNVPTLRNLIVVANINTPNWASAVAGTRSLVTSAFVPSGSRTLEVSAAELYREGDNVIITQPSTVAWLSSIAFGSTGNDAPWVPGDLDIFYNRYITDVNIPESKITLDAPIYDHLERSLAQSEVYTLNLPSQRREIGIENLRIDIDTDGELDENHARTAIFMAGVEDCWVKDVTGLHFSYALVDMKTATRVTITGCSALSPHSLVTGARRYNFNVSSKSNNILFKDCFATKGRHSFVSNGTSSASGIVWTNCTSEFDLSTSEGHRRWSQGLLYDKIDFRLANTPILIGLYNRGHYGTGHGWSSVNSVAWNVRTEGNRNIVVQKPPSRQNYAVGCHSNVSGNGPFPQLTGYIELSNRTLEIPSLYAEQFAQRMANGALPDAPARLAGTLSEGVVTLEWLDIASGETAYKVEISQDGGSTFTEIADLPANSTSYVDSAPVFNEQNLLYRAYSVRNGLPSPYSNPVTVRRAVSIREATATELTISPNPVMDHLRIQSAEPITDVQVYTAAGALIAQSRQTDSLTTTNWPPGVYYLKIKLQSGTLLSSRVVKQ
ncbi:MAG: hypothetical protein ACI81P_002118 [Neolewinella sp.]|jgi:hypothetical protein